MIICVTFVSLDQDFRVYSCVSVQNLDNNNYRFFFYSWDLCNASSVAQSVSKGTFTFFFFFFLKDVCD